MTVKDQLMEDMKNAMRAHETLKLDMVRMIRSEIKNYEIDNGEADDEAAIKIIKRMFNQQKDALGDFEKAAREDLVEETKAKMEVLSGYLPKELSDEELEKIVKEVVDSATDKNFGPLMGQVMKKVGNLADGGRVNACLRKFLA